MQSGLHRHYERGPTSLVSKLWPLWRFNARHGGRRHGGRHEEFDDKLQGGIISELWEMQSFSLFFPAFSLPYISLHFTLWEGENNFGGWGRSLIHPSFSPPNDFDLSWNSVYRHMTGTVSFLCNEFWRIIHLNHHHAALPAGRAVLGTC